MQPISGLHVGSLIDPRYFDVRLHHEDWHGPFDPARCAGYDLVFLSGLQPDFDRMRQLSYFFRRSGATVVAGGSICTSFPEFATRFFDVVCAGGVDSVPDVVADYLRGSLKPIYRSPAAADLGLSRSTTALWAKSGIDPFFHLMESSRGCRFKCNFCVMPSEVGYSCPLRSRDARGRDRQRRFQQSALELSPLVSDGRAAGQQLLGRPRPYARRWPRCWAAHPRLRGWSALVTQNVLHDRELVRTLARSKCVALFAGLESLDQEMLRRYNKTQNLIRHQNVIDDVAFAESLGIAILLRLSLRPSSPDRRGDGAADPGDRAPTR